MESRKTPKQRIPRAPRSSIATPGTLPSLTTGAHAIVTSRETAGKVYSFDLPGQPLFWTIAAGAVATRTQVLYSQYPLFVKLATAFQEFRFRGIRLLPATTYQVDSAVTSPSSLTPGYVALWADETTLGTVPPVASDMVSRNFCQVPTDARVQPDKKREIQWVATDVEDLDWVSIKNGAYTSFVPFTVCAFASPGFGAGGTGTLITTTCTVAAMHAARIEFRGLSTV